MPVADASPSPRRLLPVLALVVTTLLALALWGLAVRQVVTGVTPGRTSATGIVTDCPSAPLGPGCTVRYADPAGVVREQPIDRPGLVGVAEGDLVPLALVDDGSISVRGWRLWVDALILAGLAVACTTGATRWLRTVLAESDRRALVHGADLTLLDEDRPRGHRGDGGTSGLRDVG
ncbi:hypothetical protein [Mobilicoccus pelagius]|uniref:Uncharacterized protein n=1 Tax=Mobilicoccus pelagius NBRC 104925 TaxID=1089455 RepID=H5UW23_9MICO|nr:hypothetical protein [Mobilicoccus pelagius]GAB49931.1 hypothetical protein MOPEL_135_01690 [Mobilicoccus pelagius NBRC 104925]